MTFIDVSGYSAHQPIDAGNIYSRVGSFFSSLSLVEQTDIIVSGSNVPSEATPLEKRLSEIQEAISGMSMHLRPDFGQSLNCQFANMLDQDAWEDCDDLPSLDALPTFLQVVMSTGATRRPGIGSNGSGSISAFWTNGGNRLTVECLPELNTTWVLTRIDANDHIERAAGECKANRLIEVLRPYHPDIWFDQ